MRPIRQIRFGPPVDDAMQQHPANGAVSVHFVNNVLAAAASYVEEDPDAARDALAELGAFLTHRLRPPRAVPLQEEIDHVGVYLRLQEFRFPGRLDARLPERVLGRVLVGAGDVQRPVGAALDGWLARRPGRVRVRLEAGETDHDLALALASPDTPDLESELITIHLAPSVRSNA
jgi:LytS/YehU family sensor histidine kinase